MKKNAEKKAKKSSFPLPQESETLVINIRVRISNFLADFKKSKPERSENRIALYYNSVGKPLSEIGN